MAIRSSTSQKHRSSALLWRGRYALDRPEERRTDRPLASSAGKQVGVHWNFVILFPLFGWMFHADVLRHSLLANVCCGVILAALRSTPAQIASNSRGPPPQALRSDDGRNPETSRRRDKSACCYCQDRNCFRLTQIEIVSPAVPMFPDRETSCPTPALDDLSYSRF